MEAQVCVGVVGGAQGIRGQVRIRSHTANPADVAAYGPVEDRQGRRFVISVMGDRGGGVVLARIAGIEDRTAAEALKGTELYIPRTALPKLSDDDGYYWSDLIGLTVTLENTEETGASQRVGTVKAVHDFGAGTMLEVMRPTEPSVMVPFTTAAVPVVDIVGGRLVISRAGLVDDGEQ